MNDVIEIVRAVLGLGLESEKLGALQMAVRAVVVYLVALAVVRVGKKRFMGRATAFDVILGIMLGSIVSRAVTGNAPFFPALGASAVLMAMHWLVSAIAMRWHGFGVLVKGEDQVLIRNGKLDDHAMRKAHLTERDVWEDLRDKGVSRLEQVAEARLERSGKLSVIHASSEPKVVEVDVGLGVQRVRIQLT